MGACLPTAVSSCCQCGRKAAVSSYNYSTKMLPHAHTGTRFQKQVTSRMSACRDRRTGRVCLSDRIHRWRSQTPIEGLRRSVTLNMKRDDDDADDA